MLQENEFIFTQEEERLQAEANAVAMLVAATKYLQSEGMEIEAFWDFAGSMFIPRWTHLEAGNVPITAEFVAQHIAGFGAEVSEYSVDVDQARLVFTDFPPQWAQQVSGLSGETLMRACRFFAPVMRSLGFDYSWAYEEGKTTILIKR